MSKNGNGKLVTPPQAHEAAEALSQLMTVAKTGHGGEPLFERFKILKDVTNRAAKGALAYKEGRFDEALAEFTEGRNALLGVLRAYARGSVEKYFSPQLEEIVTEGFDEDLVACVRKGIESLQDAVRNADFDIAKAAEAY